MAVGKENFAVDSDLLLNTTDTSGRKIQNLYFIWCISCMAASLFRSLSSHQYEKKSDFSVEDIEQAPATQNYSQQTFKSGGSS